ncbi:MAG: class I lanthipeptide, partial [Flammeovirgaceae bacterium]
MKKLKINKKLSLNNETLSSLDKSEMVNVKG